MVDHDRCWRTDAARSTVGDNGWNPGGTRRSLRSRIMHENSGWGVCYRISPTDIVLFYGSSDDRVPSFILLHYNRRLRNVSSSSRPFASLRWILDHLDLIRASGCHRVTIQNSVNATALVLLYDLLPIPSGYV